MVSVASTPYPYLYEDRNDFINKFNEMLDATEQYDTTEIAKSMLWDERISKWFNNWDGVFDLKEMQETESLLKIKDYIHQKKFVTKKDILEYMGWGVRIKWSGYRNTLRKYSEIKFTKNGYEWIGN